MPLELGLDRALAAYARHMLVGDRALPVYAARLDGTHLVAEVHAPDGVQVVRRRASAYVGLCADIWGAAQAPDARALWASLAATITSHPSGGANTWDPVFELETDLDRVEGLEAIAAALLEREDADARDEAILLLRRLYEVDTSFDDMLHVHLLPRTVPAEIADAVKAPPRLPSQTFKGSTTPHAMVKEAVPYATRGEARDLLAVGMRIENALPHLSLSNHLTFLALLSDALPALLEEGDGAVHEVALGIAQNLGMKLCRRRAYAEAKALLDLVVARSVALPESLRARWECRLYLDACAGAVDLDAAEEDWRRASLLDSPDDASSLGPCMFWGGSVRDRRRVGLARVAQALVERAEGRDPCEDRKVSKKDAPSPAERTRLLARASVLSDDAISQGEARAASDIAQARAGEPITSRGFQADELAARAKVREASGDLAGALSDYEAARMMRVAAGLAWQIDHFGPDVRRLRRRRAGDDGNDATPPSFDPDWLVDPARTTEAREAAAAGWYAQAWRIFPRSPSAARGGPIAYVVLRDVLARSAALFPLAAEDGVALGDRVAFASRALALLDAWFDRRDASWLESVLDNSHEVAFFGESTHVPSKTPKERAPLFAWLAGLVAADPLDDAAVLRGLEGAPWERLTACFTQNVHGYDALRDVFDAVRGAGLSGDDVATVLRAYRELLKNDWSAFGTPRGAAAKWAKHGDALASLDRGRLAPALIAWTRAYARSGTLSAKWLWPLRYAWSEAVCPAFVEDVKRRALDNGRSLSKSAKAARIERLAWLPA